MTEQRPNRDLLAPGALSVGLAVLGVAFGVPVLPALGVLVGLTVLALLALEGLLAGSSHGSGPFAALLLAGGLAGAGLALEVWPLVLLGLLSGLAVVGGLATLGVLASAGPDGGAGTHGRQ